MINVLVIVTSFLLNNFGLAIIALTLFIRVVTIPLTLKQLYATRAMQTMQPKLLELQKKYAKDRQKLAQEQMRLYRESGVSAAGCMIPMLVQFPIWIALFQAITRVIARVPEDFLNLSIHLYSSWTAVFSIVPLNSRFLWLDMALPDHTYIFPILVAATMWIQQKMVTISSTDPRQRQQSQMMLWMMPLMFGFFTLSFPSGLALYWIVSNIFSIVIQYYVTGWGELLPRRVAKSGPKLDTRFARRISRIEAESSAQEDEKKSSRGKGIEPDSDEKA